MTPSVPVPAVTAPDVTPVVAPVQAGARDIQRVVAGAADPSAAGGGAQPAVDAAVEAVSVATPPSADAASGAAAPRGAGPAAHAARRQPDRRATPRHREDRPPARQAQHEAAPVQALPAIPRRAHTPAASPPAERAGDTAPEPASSLDPLPAGASAAGASSSLLFGGLAVLLTAFLLAGPALRHRLPSRTAMCWPAAFVPLLERPG